jgi:hypothetical protein
MLVEDPSKNTVNALMIIDSIIAACHPWSSEMRRPGYLYVITI